MCCVLKHVISLQAIRPPVNKNQLGCGVALSLAFSPAITALLFHKVKGEKIVYVCLHLQKHLKQSTKTTKAWYMQSACAHLQVTVMGFLFWHYYIIVNWINKFCLDKKRFHFYIKTWSFFCVVNYVMHSKISKLLLLLSIGQQSCWSPSMTAAFSQV